MLALAVAYDVQCRFTAVYAVSLAKRGFTRPRGLFEGPKGLEQIFAQSIEVDWEDRSSVPRGPGLGFAPDERDSHLFESLDGGFAIYRISLQIRCTDLDWPGRRP